MTDKGVKARLGDASLMVGSPTFVGAQGVDVAAHRAAITELESQGLTVIAVTRDGALFGLLALGDALRPDVGGNSESAARARHAHQRDHGR